ncbi:hypothetical protein [Oceanobacillus sp. FSL W7-1309]|uniref:hypothetical protein n=1 Tax=Oceanobacillus sp. FSL W7-1309 TaxID=2954539 RepID=UPI0030F72A30
MDFESIIAGLPIGGIIGFLAKAIWDKYIQRARPKFLLREAKLNRFKTEEDGAGGYSTRSVRLNQADNLTLYFEIIASNSGDSNTAISDVRLEVNQINDSFTRSTSDLTFSVDNEDVNRAFNLEANTCKIITILRKYTKSDYNEEFIFEDEDALKFNVIFTDVKGKKHQLKVDPSSNWTALE